MIKVNRTVLTKANGKNYLSRKDAEVQQLHGQNGFNIHNRWKSARQTKSIGKVFDALANMTAPKQRCMYCAASIAGDIEHFWPKANYPLKAFRWENLLICCTDCGRIKGDRFPLDYNSQPLLINPSNENPWTSLEFDVTNGNITAKYDVITGDFVEKGVKTVEVLHFDKREALAESYLRSFNRIIEAIQHYLREPTSDLYFLNMLKLADENCLLEWCFLFNGQYMKPFIELKNQFPNTWSYVRATF